MIMTVLNYTVGNNYPKTIIQEGAKLNYHRGDSSTQWELHLALHSPQDYEVKGFNEGIFDCRLGIVWNIPFFCFRILLPDSSQTNQYKIVLPWAECPVHAICVGGLTPNLEEGKRIILLANFVDHATGKIVALRTFTLSPHFSRALTELIQVTANAFPSEVAYNQTLNTIYNSVPVVTISSSCQLYSFSGE
jgi:hypothetical protein